MLVLAGLVGHAALADRAWAATTSSRSSASPGPHWWRLFTAVFTYNNTGYAFVTLGAIALFGWLLERRHGPIAVLGLFLVGGVGGLAATAAVYAGPGRAGRQRRRAGPAVRLGACRTCWRCEPARRSTAT